MRRRLAQKFEFLTEDLAAPREPTAEELAAFLEQRREHYSADRSVLTRGVGKDLGMIVTSSIVFLCVAGGAMLGLYLRDVLPAHHLSAESRDVVKLGMGLIGTMTALLLGMQIGSAKDGYDATDAEIKEIAGKIAFLDRVMANYGPETNETRQTLRAAVARALEQIWDKGAPADLPSPTQAGGESLYLQLHQLSPDNAVKAAMKAEAITLATEVAALRWLMFAQSRGSGSMVFLVIVVIWLTLVFMSFGLFGVPNATVIVTLLICALSVSAAIGLIMELNRPFGGLIQISSEPLRTALTLLGA